MVDSIAVFPPAFRILNADGTPASGAQVRFWEGGTNNPLAVNSAADLGGGTSLGPIVYTRSDGLMVASQGSQTTVAVYTGSAPYDVDVVDENDVTIVPRKINQRGALDTSNFITNQDASNLNIPVLTVNENITADATYNGKVVNLNTSSGSRTVTLSDAAVLGNGWSCTFRKTHANNTATIQTNGVQTIDESLLSIVFNSKNDLVEIVCDGADFYIKSSRIRSREKQIGDIRLCSAGAARTGELECNGASYLRADYPDLYAFVANAWGTADGTHFNVPKLSGRMLRIWDHGAGVDPDAAGRTAASAGGATGDSVGSVQGDDYKAHQHFVANVDAVSGGGDLISATTTLTQGRVGQYVLGGTATAATFGKSSQMPSTGGNETRGKNAYVAAYILATTY